MADERNDPAVSKEPPAAHSGAPIENGAGGDDRVDDDAENDEEENIAYNISSYGADYTVDGIVKRLREGAFYVPSFQRSYVWSITQASRFVESLLFGLPVPGVFLAKESETNKHLVVDGQQRLKSLQFFFDNDFKSGKFRLRNVNSRWSGKTFHELGEEERRYLEDSVIHCTIFKQDRPADDDTSFYHIFERLNTGGSTLYPQEIRHCIDHGKITELLDRCNDVPDWRYIFGKKSERLKDQELILRFMAFFVEGHSRYARPMKDFLNKFSRKNRHIAYEKSHEMYRVFRDTVGTVRGALGETAFRPEGRLNAAVYEAVMVAVARRLERESALDPRSVRESCENLLANDEFRNACARATTNERNVETRHRLASSFFDAET